MENELYKRQSTDTVKTQDNSVIVANEQDKASGKGKSPAKT